MISTNLSSIYVRIEQALKRCGRDTDSVRVLAVTKTRDILEIQEAHDNGLKTFGESYVSETVEKIQVRPEYDWHYIGPIQSNKCKKITEHFSIIQSLSRQKDAVELNKHAKALGKNLTVYIQFDPQMESSKHGAGKLEIPALADVVKWQSHLTLGGIMMIAPNIPIEQRREHFRKCKSIFDTLRAEHPTCTTLSMGMSDDFEIAIEEGATMVRIGSLLFGPRINQ